MIGNKTFLTALAAGLCLLPGPVAAGETGADIVESMEEARREDEEPSGREQYLEKRYTQEEMIIVRTPGVTIVDTVEVPKTADPEPFHSTNLSEPEPLPE